GAPSGGGTGGSPTGHYETKTDPGGTGSEAGKLIPVCCVPSATEKTRITEGFNLLNQHRVANGRSALAYDTKLEATIEGHCHHMAVHTFFSHTAPEASVSSPWTRANLCGTSANGENIFYGSSSAQSAMTAWINSPGHNANMLSTSFKRVGIGNYNTQWGQIFGN
ncbi:MAG: CAP domain-containing protein, partial [Sorangiineae bacterium PRO1]|nr:CAP domain-containing protein [Sorangiineae bacterium PRO1]